MHYGSISYHYYFHILRVIKEKLPAAKMVTSLCLSLLLLLVGSGIIEAQGNILVFIDIFLLGP